MAGTRKSSPAPAPLVRAFERAVRSLRGIDHRKMFGYPAVFVRGHMVAGLVRDGMVIRLAAQDVDRFLALPGARPFVAMDGRRMKQWVVVPPAMLTSGPALKRWLARARAHARALPAKPPRSR